MLLRNAQDMALDDYTCTIRWRVHKEQDPVEYPVRHLGEVTGVKEDYTAKHIVPEWNSSSLSLS